MRLFENLSSQNSDLNDSQNDALAELARQPADRGRPEKLGGMAQVGQVTLVGGPPWGFRLCPGAELVVGLVVGGSRAEAEGLRQGDRILSVNARHLAAQTPAEAQRLLRKASGILRLTVLKSKPRPSLPSAHRRVKDELQTAARGGCRDGGGVS